LLPRDGPDASFELRAWYDSAPPAHGMAMWANLAKVIDLARIYRTSRMIKTFQPLRPKKTVARLGEAVCGIAFSSSATTSTSTQPSCLVTRTSSFRNGETCRSKRVRNTRTIMEPFKMVDDVPVRDLEAENAKKITSLFVLKLGSLARLAHVDEKDDKKA